MPPHRIEGGAIVEGDAGHIGEDRRRDEEAALSQMVAWALEIIMGVEQVARENSLAVVLSEMQGRRTPGRGWIEYCGKRPRWRRTRAWSQREAAGSACPHS